MSICVVCVGMADPRLLSSSGWHTCTSLSHKMQQYINPGSPGQIVPSLRVVLCYQAYLVLCTCANSFVFVLQNLMCKPACSLSTAVLVLRAIQASGSFKTLAPATSPLSHTIIHPPMPRAFNKSLNLLLKSVFCIWVHLSLNLNKNNCCYFLYISWVSCFTCSSEQFFTSLLV